MLGTFSRHRRRAAAVESMCAAGYLHQHACWGAQRMPRSIGGIRALVGACPCAEGACDHCESTCSRDPASSPGFDALTAAAHNSRHAAPRSLAGTPPRAGCAAAARSSPLWWPCHNISARMAHGVCLLTPLRPAAGDRAGAGAAHQAAMLSLLNYDPRRHSPGPKAAQSQPARSKLPAVGVSDLATSSTK